MLTVSRGLRLFMATQPTDFRKSFDGLAVIVRAQLGRSPTSGDLFVFLNRRATQLRILFWDGDGFCLFMKRLEKGTFRRLSPAADETHLEITSLELSMLLEGIDVDGLRRRPRFRLEASSQSQAA